LQQSVASGFANRRGGNACGMTFLIAIVLAFVVLVSLVAFPFVGLAMIPVIVLGVAAGLAWLWITARRGPAALPEHPAPLEEGATAPRASDAPRETRADRNA
jgi:hypothetical protein